MRRLTWLVKKLCTPGSIVYGNCYLAFLLIYRFGGHLIITKSVSHSIILHVAWAPDLGPIQALHRMPALDALRTVYKRGGHLILRRPAGKLLLEVAWTPRIEPTKVLHLLPVIRRYGAKSLLRSHFFKGKWVWQVIPRAMEREASDATLDNYVRSSAGRETQGGAEAWTPQAVAPPRAPAPDTRRGSAAVLDRSA